jgi:4-amino-4-deoxy-L-arabinose transferase-like glycosyltransferase
MDSPQSNEYRLRRVDYLLLLLLCGVLYASSLINPRVLNSHETTHCLNVREMIASGDWFIPTYGGRPWLERPPLPHWLTAPGVLLLGEDVPDRAYRIGPIIVATLAVLIFARAIAGCLGRTAGLMSGVIFATMREFVAYATGPEADIFLGATVTVAGALLMRSLFSAVAGDKHTSFVGRRSWSTVGFFALLGLMNAMKGPLFGMFFLVLPLGAYFLVSRKQREIRPLIWLWGWLITLALGVAWPCIAYWRYPDIIDLWAIDYGVRWRAGYLGEPSWYYLVEQPWNVFPWTLAIFMGFIATARALFRGDSPALRFLWCWTIVPVLFFSLFKGKHHHYMLSCMAPAAAIAVFGARDFWQRMQQWPDWLRQPWLAVPLIGVPGTALVWLLRAKIPGPHWVIVGWMIMWPLVVVASWWSIGRRSGRTAFGGFCIVSIVVHLSVYEYRTKYAEEYNDDLEFLRRTAPLATKDRPLLVLGEVDPLNPSWCLFYLNGSGKLLHNDTYLLDDRITDPSVLVICRQRYEPYLRLYGTAEMVEQSHRARYEHSRDDRYTLYNLTFFPHLTRAPANVRMTPLQATGREPGPYLNKIPVQTAMSPH